MSKQPRSFLNSHFEMTKEELRNQAFVLIQRINELDEQFDSLRTEAILIRSEQDAFLSRQIIGVLRQMSHLENLAVDSSQSQNGFGESISQMNQRIGSFFSDVEALIKTVEAKLDLQTLGTSRRLEDISDAISRLEASLFLVKDAAPSKTELISLPQLPTSQNQEAINHFQLSNGYLASTGLWINRPEHIGYESGRPKLFSINERIGEIPFVFSCLAALPMGSKIIDIGSCESTVSVSLATLGYEVTAIDPRPYPFSHLNLQVINQYFENYETSDSYDAAILLSSIEHFGVGSYGLEKNIRADIRAMEHVREILRPGGLALVTIPFGKASVNDFERTYDEDGLEELFQGFEFNSGLKFLRQVSKREWIMRSTPGDYLKDDTRQIALVCARLVS